jgi:hypothetical protein
VQAGPAQDCNMMFGLFNFVFVGLTFVC